MGRDYCVKCDARLSSSDGTSFCDRCEPVDLDEVRSSERNLTLDEVLEKLLAIPQKFIGDDDEKFVFVSWTDVHNVLSALRKGGEKS